MYNVFKPATFFCLCFYASTVFAATKVYFSQNEIEFGKTTILIFESDEEIKTQPNLEIIEKDFKILGKSQSSNISVVNGVVNKKNKISYTLYPYQKGIFNIGPIEFDGQKFDSVQLKVVDTPIQQTNTHTSQPVSIKFETKIMPSQIYEGQVALYQATITDENNLFDANLKTPLSNNFIFTPLNADKTYQITKDGKNQRVFERFFIVTPKNTGSFHIPPAQLSGIVPETAKKQNQDIMADFFNFPFDFQFHSNGMKPLYFNSNETSIEILSKPTDWKGWWFPSNKAEILEEYTMPDKIYLGDVIERKITLKASNIDNAKLPLLEHPKGNDLSVFANQEERFSEFKDNEILSIENRSFVLSFQKEGKQTIPAIHIKYFNTQSKSEEILTLPAKEVEILKSTNNLNTNTENQTHNSPPQQDTPINTKTEKNSFISLVSLISGIIGCFILMLIWGLHLKKLKKKENEKIILFEKTEKSSKKKKKKKPLPDLYPF